MVQPPLYESRAQYSTTRLNELRNRLGKLPEVRDFPGLTIFAAGSYGRLEASEHSDIDLFFFVNKEAKDLEDPVSILIINDPTVGPHLQLLRLVCEPSSMSKPHVTVRYFERLVVPDEYRRTRVTHIDLIEPGMFKPAFNGEPGIEKHEAQTVFIRCKSDDLAPLEHKPHFPGSDFHITIYNGPSRTFARKLLLELERHRWSFRAPLLGPTTLTFKELKQPRSARTRVAQEYQPELRDLFHAIASEELTREYLESLSERERLRLCRAILKSLFAAVRHFERVSPRRPTYPKQPDRSSDIPDLPEVHLTPPELAREIAAFAVSQIEDPDEPIDFGDPSVGTGAFFAALLQLIPKERLASAIGVDINSEQVAAARWRWADKGMRVLSGDYLHMDRLPGRSLILANPPYLRHQSIPADYKERLLQRASVRTDIRVNARSGLYVYFLLLAHDWMREDAVAAWLIPSEFMYSVYGAALRQYLAEKVELLRVHVYGQNAPKFEAVDVSPAVIVFRNRKPRPDHLVCFTKGGSLKAPGFEEFITVADLRGAAVWSVPLRRNSEPRGEFRIGDLFTVRRGIATGANGFFVMTRERARELGIPRTATRPLLPKIKSLTTDVIDADSDGYPRLTPQLCVIDCDMPEDQLRRRHPRFMEYLSSAKPLGILRRRLVRDRKPWYKQEQRDPPPFLCTYMGRGGGGKPPLRFIWNKSKAIATNTYLLLYPKPPLAHILSRVPDSAREILAALQLAALNGIRENARVYAGGLLKVEPGELSEAFLSLPSRFLRESVQEQLALFK